MSVARLIANTGGPLASRRNYSYSSEIGSIHFMLNRFTRRGEKTTPVKIERCNRTSYAHKSTSKKANTRTLA